MASPRWFRRPASLSVRLTLLFSATTAFLLVALAGPLYWSLNGHLTKQNQRALSEKLAALTLILEEQPGQMAPLREEIQWEAGSRSFTQYYSRVLNRSGGVILETQGMSERLKGAPFPLATPGGVLPRAVTWQADSEHTFLLGSAWAREGRAGGVMRQLQVAADTSDDNELLEDYRRNMALALTAGLAVAALLGFLVTRRGLRPLDAMARKAQQVSAERLHERMGKEAWPTELAILASAFDDMLARLDQSFSRLSAFSADLAHDLRTPLTNCMGEVEVALSQPRPPEEYRAILESSLEELTRLAQMIESLLFLARADNVQTQITKLSLDARREMEAMAELYDAVAQEQGVTLACSGAGTLDADPTLLRRALGNLLSNAIRHTPPGGRVALNAMAEEAGTIVLCVRDTGPGIPPEDVTRLFDRFYRSPQSRSQNPQGLGLGLAIVKSIMDLHGGWAEIQNAHEGGTEVRLTFPADPSKTGGLGLATKNRS
jgi:two-component system heavy metal sensor histidine kinase CusS